MGNIGVTSNDGAITSCVLCFCGRVMCLATLPLLSFAAWTWAIRHPFGPRSDDIDSNLRWRRISNFPAPPVRRILPRETEAADVLPHVCADRGFALEANVRRAGAVQLPGGRYKFYPLYDLTTLSTTDSGSSCDKAGAASVRANNSSWASHEHRQSAFAPSATRAE